MAEVSPHTRKFLFRSSGSRNPPAECLEVLIPEVRVARCVGAGYGWLGGVVRGRCVLKGVVVGCWASRCPRPCSPVIFSGFNAAMRMVL